MVELKDVMIVSPKDFEAIQGIAISFFCCDDAVENEAFERLCKKKGLVLNSKILFPVHHSKRKSQTEICYTVKYDMGNVEWWEMFLF